VGGEYQSTGEQEVVVTLLWPPLSVEAWVELDIDM